MSLSFALKCRTVLQCCRRPAAFDPVRIILGVLLLAAAALKGYQLAAEPTIETSLLTSHWFLMAVVELELLLGVWLLAGVFPNALRWTALVWFVLLLGTSLSQAVGGARSCACFGFVEVAPWVVAFVDAVAVSALWLFRPVVKLRKMPIHLGRVAVIFAIMLYFGVAISGAAAMWQWRNNVPLLTASTPVINLGTITQGESRNAITWLDNSNETAVIIERIEKSCPCLEIEIPKTVVDSRKKVKAIIRFDSNLERQFVGDLRLRAMGKTINGRIAFLIVIKTNVLPHGVVNFRDRVGFNLW